MQEAGGRAQGGECLTLHCDSAVEYQNVFDLIGIQPWNSKMRLGRWGFNPGRPKRVLNSQD